VIGIILVKLSSYGRELTIPFIEKVRIKLIKIRDDFISVYRIVGYRGKSLFFINIFLTTIQWSCRYSIITVLLVSFNIPIHPVKFFLFQWVVFTLIAFILTPRGSGGAEASFYFIFHPFIPAEIMGLVMACWRFLTYYFQLTLESILFSFMNFRMIPLRS